MNPRIESSGNVGNTPDNSNRLDSGQELPKKTNNSIFENKSKYDTIEPLGEINAQEMGIDGDILIAKKNIDKALSEMKKPSLNDMVNQLLNETLTKLDNLANTIIKYNDTKESADKANCDVEEIVKTVAKEAEAVDNAVKVAEEGPEEAPEEAPEAGPEAGPAEVSVGVSVGGAVEAPVEVSGEVPGEVSVGGVNDADSVNTLTAVSSDGSTLPDKLQERINIYMQQALDTYLETGEVNTDNLVTLPLSVTSVKIDTSEIYDEIDGYENDYRGLSQDGTLKGTYKVSDGTILTMSFVFNNKTYTQEFSTSATPKENIPKFFVPDDEQVTQGLNDKIRDFD